MNIVFSEYGALTKDEEKVANIFNNFFVNIVPNLGWKTQHQFFNTTDNSQDPIENVICKYENAPVLFQLRNIWKTQILPLFLRLSKQRNLKN